MDVVWENLAGTHGPSGIRFLKVEAEAVPEVTGKLEVSVVPTFVLIEAGEPIGAQEGADPPALATWVAAFAASKSGKEVKKESSGPPPEELKERLDRLINSAPIMLFCKGSPAEPKCKFSREIIALLTDAGIHFGSFDILKDNEVREGLKQHSDWQTYPQLYNKGEFVGGVDIVREHAATPGGLKAVLNIEEVPAASADAAAGVVEETALDKRCKQLISRAPVMLFMKGSPSQPRCGFSRSICKLLKEEAIAFDSYDILQDEEVRQRLKDISDWQTYPQLYVNGDFKGGIDILNQMKEEGDLKEQLGV